MSRKGKKRQNRGPIDVGPEFELDRGNLNTDPNQYRPAMRTAVVHHVVTVFLVVMVLAIGTWGYLTFKDADIFEPGGFSLKAPLYEVPATDAQLRRYQFALGVYFKLYEKYPPSLEELVDEGLLDSSDLNYPPGADATFVYERVGDSYKLTMERTTVETKVVPAEAEEEAAEAKAEPAEDAQEEPSE